MIFLYLIPNNIFVRGSFLKLHSLFLIYSIANLKRDLLFSLISNVE